MTTRSANKRRDRVLSPALWMTGLVFVAGALGVAHAEQRNPAKATIFGYVANESVGTVSVIDTDKNKVVATIPVGGSPVGVATTPDGKHAYVTNVSGALGTVSVIETASNKLVGTVPVGSAPLFVAITPDGTRAYVTNEGSSTVSVISLASNTVVATIPVGTQFISEPLGVAITSDGTYAYVANSGDNTISVIDTARNTVMSTIPVGHAPFGVAITPDGTHAYVTNARDNTVSVIDTASNTTVATIPVGQFPEGVAITTEGFHPYEDDDRRHQPLAYVTNFFENTVSVIDTASNTVVTTIPVGGEPFGVAFTRDENCPHEHDDPCHSPLAYVTNDRLDTVSVIDTARNTVVATIPVGIGPEGAAFATVTSSQHPSKQ